MRKNRKTFRKICVAAMILLDCGEKVIHDCVTICIQKGESITIMNKKYTEKMRQQTAAYVIESGKSARSVAEEMRIDKNTVCRWVRVYSQKHGMPTYAKEHSIKKATKDIFELKKKIKELESQLKEKDKEIKLQKSKLTEEKMSVEILKKSQHIFIQPLE